MPVPVAFCWSGGKDSAFALYRLMQDQAYEVKCLFTTVNAHYRRVTMHGVREELLDQQALAIDLQLRKIYLTQNPDNNEYDERMQNMLLELKNEGITHIAFGDIFLEDLKVYRDEMLQKLGLTGIYPLWKESTAALINEFIDAGFETITCCISDGFLNEAHVGKIIDRAFVQGLPANVDVCGENGEFHTFCFDGPLFKKPVPFSIGEKLYRPLQVQTTDNTTTQGFWYIDLF